MKNIKGTPAWWQRVKSDMSGMVRQIGAFHWLLTFSFNDLVYAIPAILKLMSLQSNDEILTDISCIQKHELLRMEPVIPVRMFDKYINKILSYLIDKRMLFGSAEAYFGRPEFGNRGSPNFHMMLKCKDAPTVGVNPVKDLVAYIDKHVTTHRPSIEEHPELHNLLKLQTYRHTKTCTKGKTDTVCRFAFPRAPSKCTQIIGLNESEVHDDDIKSAKKIMAVGNVLCTNAM